jgi:putative PIN family toxin of toxin-antitoxin system
LKRKSLRVVVDNSVWVSAVGWRGRPFAVFRAWEKGLFRTIVSNPIVEEFLDALRRLNFEDEPIERWRRRFSRRARAINVRPRVPVTVCRDPEDNMILEAALAGKAEYIVTSDSDQSKTK